MGKGIEACAPMNFGTHFRGENLKSTIFSIGFPNPGFQGSVRKASRAQYCMHPNTVRGIETIIVYTMPQHPKNCMHPNTVRGIETLKRQKLF